MSRRGATGALLALLLAPAARPAAGQAAAPGGALYQKYCSQCHGEKGDGLGIAAPRLQPRPRDFTSGKFKIRHTPSGSLPTDDDLRHVIREGMPYTSMPAWKQLSDTQIDELVKSVKSFSPDFTNPERTPKPVSIPKAPDYSQESAKKGKEVYARIGCAACHGEIGRGDGPSAPGLKDDWGHSIRPADLTKRWTFRGGPTREDVYRTFTTGINGTPMPSFAESLSDAERWQLVDYISSLDPRDAPGYSDLLQVQWTTDEIDLAKGGKLFESAPAGAEGGDVWGGEEAPAADAAAADPFAEEADTGAAPASEFSDAVAIQLPAQLPSGARKPYFLFGDAQNPVDLWFVDLANKVVRRYVGAGSSSLTASDDEEVSAVASYDRGEWSVLFKRPLRGSGGLTFAEGQYVPIAFSLWDGGQKERGSKRGLTRWVYLYTSPKETPSTLWPMLRAALAVLVVEILLIVWVRRRQAPARQDREVPLHV